MWADVHNPQLHVWGIAVHAHSRDQSWQRGAPQCEGHRGHLRTREGFCAGSSRESGKEWHVRAGAARQEGSGSLRFSYAAQSDPGTLCGTQRPLLYSGVVIPAGQDCPGFDGHSERAWHKVGVSGYEILPTTMVTAPPWRRQEPRVRSVWGQDASRRRCAGFCMWSRSSHSPMCPLSEQGLLLITLQKYHGSWRAQSPPPLQHTHTTTLNTIRLWDSPDFGEPLGSHLHCSFGFGTPQHKKERSRTSFFSFQTGQVPELVKPQTSRLNYEKQLYVKTPVIKMYGD